MNPLRTIKKVKGVFIRPRLYIQFRKNNPGLYLYQNPKRFIDFQMDDLMWKDKYDTPRFEREPFFMISFFRKWFIVGIWKIPESYNDWTGQYWEQILWYLYYYNTLSQGRLDKPDINKAKESWPWVDFSTQESTWNDKFLVK